MIGQDIRRFFRQLLGSRMVEHLEVEIAQLRNDYETRLADFRSQVTDLQNERAVYLAKVAQLEGAVFPLASRAGASLIAKSSPKPNFGGEAFQEEILTPWQKAQYDWDLQQEAEDNEVKATAKASA